ncbi:glycosyltransferase family 2 protein [Gordonia desulfuricans]|uniref:glycosyltransferase family 2 protein n=1 Tax=Gordonia desulfuricans TaxID=89051 RepID=UPI000AB504F0|nr:glycosyltransferase [Gordonia desulfuricans]
MPSAHPRAISVCVVICCYTADRRDLLTRAIDAALAQTEDGDRLVVVVDHNDALRTELDARLAGDDRATVVANTGTRGLSGARNTGVANASQDVVVFLDDDAVLRPGGLAAARAAFTDTAVLAIGGQVDPAWASGTAPRWFPDEFGWVVGCDYRGIAADGADIRNPIGAAMAVRRVELEKIGGFTDRLGRVDDLPVGCEETLMGIELHRTFPDGRILRTTGLAVDHTVSPSRETLRYFISRCRHEGKSKATLRQIAGSGDAFSAEATYLVRTIGSGVGRYLGQLVRGDVTALARLAMMLIGVLATVAGTAAGTVRQMLTPRRRTTASGTGSAPRRAVGAIRSDDLVSIVIPTVGRDLLVETVEAALAQDHPAIEVIVVDNRPTSGHTRALLADHTDPRLRIVDEPVPGISAARNAGNHAAHGRIVAFTDDDARPRRDWVSQIVSAFTDDPTGTVAVVTGRVIGVEDPTQLQEMFENAKVFDKGAADVIWALNPHPAHLADGVSGPHNAFFPYTAGQFGSGNNMAFAAGVLDGIGGFDLRLGTGTPTRGGEDLDVLRAVILDGDAIAYRPNAVVVHYHRDNMDDLRVQSYGYGTGMSAALTKLLFSRHVFAVLARLPKGVRLLLVPDQETASAFAREGWPAELRHRELRGYLAGPFLFVRGHLRYRAARRAEAQR